MNELIDYFGCFMLHAVNNLQGHVTLQMSN